MDDREKDILEDLFHSKLYDFEEDTSPGDWDLIADRLPQRNIVPFYRRAPFRVAVAAAVAIMLVVAGGLFMFERESIPPEIAGEIKKQTDELRPEVEQKNPYTNPIAEEVPVKSVKKETVLAQKQKATKNNMMILPVKEESDEKDDQPAQVREDEQKISEAASDVDNKGKDAATESLSGNKEGEKTWIADAGVRSTKKSEPKKRRWGFGMGAGGVSVGSSNVVSDYMVSTMGLRSEDLIMLNAANPNKSLPKTDVKHHKPISFGLGVSYYLNDRFSLQSGLTYSYLSSNWKTSDEYHVKTTQRLHMIGIPLALTYKIAEWNRFNFYASAGFLAEMNVSGTQKGELLRDVLTNDIVISSEKRSVRSNRLLWSANAKVGVSYPIVKFLSAYGEVGAGYYFDNGSAFFDSKSDSPAIYSEKPFNVNLQLGFRLGF